MRFEVISLDMFQTLVNVNSRMEEIWRPILGEAFHPEMAREHALIMRGHFSEEWRRLRDGAEFVLLREIYSRSFELLFREKGIAACHREAADILLREHRQALFYEETADFLCGISGRYKLCITSDADDVMIPGFYQRYGAQLFTSEQCQSYKNDSGNRIFKEVLRHYRVPPERILHIGDSHADILGARREGMAACWINRSGLSWEGSPAPDYTVHSLRELTALLGGGGKADTAAGL